MNKRKKFLVSELIMYKLLNKGGYQTLPPVYFGNTFTLEIVLSKQ
jgi:hypothetical protein